MTTLMPYLFYKHFFYDPLDEGIVFNEQSMILNSNFSDFQFDGLKLRASRSIEIKNSLKERSIQIDNESERNSTLLNKGSETDLVISSNA